jgi:hypothetical protein
MCDGNNGVWVVLVWTALSRARITDPTAIVVLPGLVMMLFTDIAKEADTSRIGGLPPWHIRPVFSASGGFSFAAFFLVAAIY